MASTSATASTQTPRAPEMALARLWLLAVALGGISGALYATATTPLGLGAALLLMPFLHGLASTAALLLLMLGALLVRGHSRDRPAARARAGWAWALLGAWSLLHAGTFYVLTAFPFFTMLSPSSVVMTWACCALSVLIMWRGALAFLTHAAAAPPQSWVDGATKTSLS